jgi:hypothetical protein
MRVRNANFRYANIKGRKQYVGASVADPHHFNAYTNADPDPAGHFDSDPDPTFHFDPDPDLDPGFQIKAQNLEKVLKQAYIPRILTFYPQIDADPDPAYRFDADPDPTFQSDALIHWWELVNLLKKQIYFLPDFIHIP